MIGLAPDITSATAVRHGVLALTFADGTTDELDVLDRMHGPVFTEARTPEGFERVTTALEPVVFQRFRPCGRPRRND
jgi:hypothetical protein